jgi:hypothetical protein
MKIKFYAYLHHFLTKPLVFTPLKTTFVVYLIMLNLPMPNKKTTFEFFLLYLNYQIMMNALIIFLAPLF